MNYLKQSQNGFSAFIALVAVTLLAIVGVVGFVVLKKPSRSTTTKLPPPPVTQMETQQSSPDFTPVPTVSTSTEIDVIGKEIDSTKIESVDGEFTNLNASASSL